MKNKKNSEKKNINKQLFSTLLFGMSILMFFVVFLPGESAWLFVHNIVLGLFGFCSFLWPVLLAYVSILNAFGKIQKDSKIQILLISITIIVFCLEFYVFSVNQTINYKEIFKHIVDVYNSGTKNYSSGLAGAIVGMPFVWLMGITGARVVSSIILFVILMLLTGFNVSYIFKLIANILNFVKNKFKKQKTNNEINNTVSDTATLNRTKSKIDIPLDVNKSKKIKNLEQVKKEPDNESEFEEIAKVTQEYLKKIKKENTDSDNFKSNNSEYNLKKDVKKVKTDEKYDYPPIDLLNKSSKVDEKSISLELQNNGQMLVDTLKSFNVKTKIVDVSRGPAVTRYELQPASGVKISKITSLSDDIALNLAAAGVRIEAPIPGKAAVGVEIPNKVVSVVNMNELISSNVFRDAKSRLTVVLGRDISGKVVVTDLSKMPHLLIAGSTGSGKSVCINSFIISLLYKASPDEVKLIMIDPKVVELGVYNGIPHLLIPVVTDPKKAKGALSWAVDEMLRRYKIFAENNVRDIYSFNAYVKRKPEVQDSEGNILTKMYSIVIIIDELSDLMMVAPNEIEDYICRLAQMARAAGMHLVIATQRPSVDVITGIIKANIPSRIALAVSSQVDSRTIIDMSGAEKLLGRGDMLFYPLGASKPIRVQGCYVTDNEIESIIKYVKYEKEIEYSSEIMDEIDKNAEMDKRENSNNEDSAKEEDPLMHKAIECVILAGQASTSLLQRRLGIGYARAGRIIDNMESMGIIGPHEGSKPRQVLITQQQFHEMNLRNCEL